MRKALAALMVLGLLLGISLVRALGGSWTPLSGRCTPPVGGRCAADLPWPGRIMVSPDGRRLHGTIICGGTLHVVSQTSDRVVVRFHVDAMGAGSMSCARVEVTTPLRAALDGRPVYDAVSERRLVVVADQPQARPDLQDRPLAGLSEEP